MTEPAPSGGPSPLRVGGLALLGAGVVAALIGLATLLPGSGSGTGETTAAAPPVTDTVQVAPPPGVDTVVPTTSVTVVVPSFPTTNAVAAPAAPPAAPAGAGTGGNGSANAGGSGGGTGGSPVAQRGAVRVYNNSKITGLAAHAADDFRGDGWKVEQVSNYPFGTITTSTVYFRPGTAEQSSASRLGSEFGLRVQPRFSGIDDASPGLIVIVTNDYQKR